MVQAPLCALDDVSWAETLWWRPPARRRPPVRGTGEEPTDHVAVAVLLWCGGFIGSFQICQLGRLRDQQHPRFLEKETENGEARGEAQEDPVSAVLSFWHAPCFAAG